LTHPVPQYGFRALISHEYGPTILLIQSGIGPNKARKNTGQLFADASWDLIISTGFAGDLETSLIGSVLIGEEVVWDKGIAPHVSSTSQSIVCHPDWVKFALGINWKEENPLRTGKFVSVDRVLTTSDDKHQMRVDSGAVGVDMESAAIGEVAQEHGAPFLIIRAISDGAYEDLPVDFNLFLRPFGWMTGIMQILRTPKSWKGFLHLYQHSELASRQLTRYFQDFCFSISGLSLSPNSLVRGPNL